ncbi:replication restart helicase PriA [Flavilitoribacter nigricans]|uniref:Replication restart protein PriA n=1 Tax=Flavilitoribacter nigricans (strain ATCC 23147 / DSM 23189 / NBRC 102662 / NCIMB 1420 / SS-2) TaxID=1122177 RepID=A0A2D0N5Z2_FLAN2|nr:primosomal protein N' [Flavilitoribacter nigricans]PHN03810.1 primosomal protein N' [Flavilitoribacter nigricans DSM 23189 = NBRC 102662]
MSEATYHIPVTETFVNVILPLATPKPYTYHVPEELIPEVKFGLRVEVQFGKQKRYSGLIIEVHQNAPEGHRTKPIIGIVDDAPLINERQLKLWNWLAGYYGCTLGEIMHAALPANLKLASETILSLSPLYDGDFVHLEDKEYLIAEALTIQDELSIEEVRDIIGTKTVYPLIRAMLEKRIIYLKEDIKEKYKPKSVACVKLAEPYASDRKQLNAAFDKLTRSERQTEALMAYIQLEKQQDYIRRQDIYKKVNADSSVLKAMEKKGVFELYDREVSRLGSYEEETVDAAELSEQQSDAIERSKTLFEKQDVVLLHGVTGSGKTRVYVELIREALERGEQVLYLLPEIALTTQITDRLQQIFGDDIAVYHSRLNNNERVEMWNAVLQDKPIVLGARSALFLPFSNLGLIVVDEEHDRSYKQHDPSPRYNGRDAAIVLAQLHGAKVLLGTATPSVETYHNVLKKKYGLVAMPERFGGIQMPEILVVDLKNEQKKRQLQSHFSSVLIAELKGALERGEQAILFQNRRGFSPTYRCSTCGWHAECVHCDVSLTYHKYFKQLKCHYCGYQTALPKNCPACGSTGLILKGFGTEKIEDELKIYLPTAKIARMDFDTVRSKHAHAQIINDFEEKRIDILVGTQMVTKGLDFENVGIVGVLSADQLLQFPDFRASERAFQLMVQVSGRAGRKHKRGKVIIQAFNTASPVLKEVFQNDFPTFINRELRERNDFLYPPFVRLIRITLKHKKPELLNDAAKLYAKLLKTALGSWVIGPAVPYISRVRGYYLLDFLIKLERDAKKIRFAKDTVLNSIDEMQRAEGFSGVRVNVDVDPF